MSNHTIRHTIRPTIRATIRAVLAAATACVLATGLVLTGGAAQAKPKPGEGPDFTDLGFRADVYGAKLVTGGVEAFNVKDAHAQQRCTRRVNQTVTRKSVVAVPDNPLVNVSASTSTTQTYQSGSRYGVRGVNTIGDIVIGGELPGGIKTPRLVIEGLKSSADAFNDDGRFGHAEDASFGGIRLELLEGTVLEQLPPQLQELLGPLTQVTDTVFTGTSAVADDVFEVLHDVTAPIQIPGLGSIGVGRTGGNVTGKSAASDATSLVVTITAGGEKQELTLGQAHTRVGKPAPAGVFRSGGTAMDLYALGDALHFGSIAHKALPCEGTLGRTVTYKVPSASLLAGTAVALTDVVYSHRGSQHAQQDLAKGFSSTHVGTVSVPAAQLEISDVNTLVKMRGKDGRKVKRTIATSVGSIVAGGQPLPVPAPGQSVELPNGMGLITHRIVSQSFYGAEVTALRIQLFAEQVRIDLATAGGRIYAK
ncbi:choice-of-anchor P family protein [Nocardioides sp. LHG3406-4]|uniref:choice-of-anchor P family protein n=1 Tax=Nocardioides sp. LHG3406-4 TaxID=2804575 RepID=UPI003CF3053A